MALALMTVSTAGNAAEARMYRCKDASGRVYYTDRPDVACLGLETDEMTKQGLVLERPDSARPEETREEREARLVQERRDRALLQTYTSEQQIETAKQRSLQRPLLGVKYAKKKLAIYTERLDQLREREAALEKADQPVPLDLIENIDATLSDIWKLETELETKQRRVDRIVDRFEADKKRYRELMARRDDK
ncbi:MAG: DUF4124 domain-containing protein [Betaproteobacteria bacterium]|jgi:hypothetical protein|nr:MAG: DUF4124 domain-containing protein [Betaproteobacteria bacterium]